MKKESHQKLCILVENMEYQSPDSFGYEIVLDFKQMDISEKWDVDVIQINSAIQSQDKYDT